MTSVLQLNSSLFSSQGASTQLADHFVAGLRAHDPALALRIRDLSAEPVPHLTAERFQTFMTPPEQRSDAQREIAAYSDALIEELRWADVIVLGLPMYNFGVPSTLRAYFDHVARAKLTFQYGPSGAEGLLKGKRAYVFATRGGAYDEGSESTTHYVRQFLAFVGITDVTFSYAERLAHGPDEKQASLEAARRAIDALQQVQCKAA